MKYIIMNINLIFFYYINSFVNYQRFYPEFLYIRLFPNWELTS